MFDKQHLLTAVTVPTAQVKPRELKPWSSHTRKKWVVCLFVQTSILFAARLAMPVCATKIASEFGWNKADLGAVMGAFFWGYITTQCIGGYMADKIGGDKVLWMSGFAWGSLVFITPTVAHLRIPQISSLALLAITRILLGISQGVHYPSLMSLLANRIPETERSLPTGIITAAANFGSLVCGGIGSVVLEYYGWEKVFYLISIIALSWTYFLWALSHKQAQTVISIDKMIFYQGSPDPGNEPGRQSEVPWRKIFTQGAVWAIVFAHFCNGNCFYILLSWLPTYFKEHFPSEKGWVYNVVPWVLSIPACVLGGYISDYLIKHKYSVGFTRKLVESLALGGCGLFGALLPFCSTFFWALLCAGMAVSLQTFHNSSVLISPQDIAPKYSGSVFGVMNAIGAIPGFLGVYITGYVLTISGSWKAVFFMMAALNCLGLTSFVLWGSGDRIV